MPADTASIAVSNLLKTTDLRDRLAFWDTTVYPRRAKVRRGRHSASASPPAPTPAPPAPTPAPPSPTPPPPPAPTPPPPPPPAPSVSAMAVGFNLAWIDSWPGMYPFNNIMLNSPAWTQVAGSGAFSQRQGSLSAAVGTDEFRVLLSDTGAGLSAGTYTVLNPNGHTFGVGNFSSNNIQTYTAATSLNFSYDPAINGLLAVRVMGSCTNLKVILPGQLSAHNAGNIWNSDFLNFHRSLGTTVVRCMDWTVASNNLETDFSDRAVPGKVTLHIPEAVRLGNNGTGGVVPYEYMIDLAERLPCDIWVCVPHRATDNYISAMAALFHNGAGAVGTIGISGVATGRKVWLELANEVWNTAYPWQQGTNWIGALNHPKLTASVNATTNIVTLSAHGYATGNILRSWTTRENRINGADEVTASADFAMCGFTTYCSAIDANTFELRQPPSAGGAIVDFPAGTVSLIVTKESLATFDEDTNYSVRANHAFSVFAAVVGTTRLTRVMAAHAANSGRAITRLSATAIASNVDCLAIAPYYAGEGILGRLSVSNGAVQASFWADVSGTVHIGVYTANATPTHQQILDGTNAIHKQSLTHTAAGGAYTTATSAVSGLVNGTVYRVWMLYNNSDATRSFYRWPATALFTPSTVAATAFVYSNFSDQAARNRINTSLTVMGYIDSHNSAIAACPKNTIRLVCYEGGNHMTTGGEPTEWQTWRETYVEDATHCEAIQHNLYMIASQNVYAHFWYAEGLGNNSIFSIADSYADTSDPRYIKFRSLSGSVAKLSKVNAADIVASDLTDSANLASPRFVASLSASPSSTFSIVAGDEPDNYSISANTVNMVRDVGIDWGTAVAEVLYIRATDGFTDDVFTVNFNVGNVAALWYENDALFAWNSSADANATQINPDKGGALSLVSGAGATIAGGLWNPGGTTSYNSTSGMSATADTSLPVLIVEVSNKGSASANGDVLVQLGVFPQFIQSIYDGGNFRFRLLTASSDDYFTCGSSDSTTRAYWFFWRPSDSRIFYGRNQIVANAGATAGQAHANPFPTVSRFVEFANTAFNYGSTEIVNRNGLDITAALAIVQKIQNVHGI